MNWSDMTHAERDAWLAVFAASWHHATTPVLGLVTDTSRATLCAAHADRAVEALRAVRPEVVR